jgi:HlyD family secretion protein
VVSETRVNVGDFVRGPAENKPLFVVTTTERVVVVVQIPGQDVSLLDRGDSATVNFFGPPVQTMKGEVSRTAYGLDPKTQTLRAEIDLPNPDGRLRAGMYCSVAVVLETHPNALTVTGSVIQNNKGKAYCYRVVNGRAVKTAIKVDMQRERKIEILEGLAAGETVVTGQTGEPLADGQEVVIVERLPGEDD